jgi:hypothetical protein
MSRCSTLVKSVPKGNAGRRPASAAGFRLRSIISGVLSRAAFGSANAGSILPASLAWRSS